MWLSQLSHDEWWITHVIKTNPIWIKTVTCMEVIQWIEFHKNTYGFHWSRMENLQLLNNSSVILEMLSIDYGIDAVHLYPIYIFLPHGNTPPVIIHYSHSQLWNSILHPTITIQRWKRLANVKKIKQLRLPFIFLQ